MVNHQSTRLIGELETPLKELVGFEKTQDLRPGESQVLTITVPVERLKSYDPTVPGWVILAGEYGICVGNSGASVCIKHFAGNNQEDNRYFVNAHVSERAFREIYLRGFEVAIKESDPISLMTSYNLVNGEHTPNRYDLLQSVCRDE